MPSKVTGPRGWNRGQTDQRFVDVKPQSYDAKARTVEAVLSAGSAVKRFYGTELLSIDASAINLDRLGSCGIPLIDSHNIFGVLDGVFGRLVRAWIDAGVLKGLIAFDDSEVGRKAEGLVARGTVLGISIGYRVDQWVITDSEGKVLDPERDRIPWDDDELTFTATRWELYEVSLVSVPADPSAFIRSVRARDTANAGGRDIGPEVPYLEHGANEITVRNGERAITYKYPEPRSRGPVTAPSEADANEAARTRMRMRQAMLERGIAV